MDSSGTWGEERHYVRKHLDGVLNYFPARLPEAEKNTQFFLAAARGQSQSLRKVKYQRKLSKSFLPSRARGMAASLPERLFSTVLGWWCAARLRPDRFEPRNADF